jgi:hypothetical protein
MTRTTLKALWFGGGGILATWVAVSPKDVPLTSQPAAVSRPALASQPEELNALTTRLRDRSSATTLRPSTRNPFRFSAPKPKVQTPRERDEPPAAVAAAIPAVPAAPVLRLSGVASQAGKRMAIIAGDGQIYLVGEGESVAGRYTVIKVDPEAVLLRDADGAERRLLLPQ